MQTGPARHQVPTIAEVDVTDQDGADLGKSTATPWSGSDGLRLRRVMASMFGPAPGDDGGPQRSLASRSLVLIWLLFLVEPLSAALGDHTTTAGHKVVVTVIAGLFALTFALLGLMPDRPERRISRPELSVIVAAMWAMTIVLVLYDRPVWDYEFIFSVFPALRLSDRRIPVIVGLAVLAGAVGIAGGLDGGDLLAVVILVVGVGASILGTFRLVEANEALRVAHTDRARMAVAEERLRFARDLHDLLGHSLSVITLKSEVAGRTLPNDPGRAAVEIDEIQAVARQALREVREAVGGYRHATLAVEIAGARTALSAAGIRWEEDFPAVDLPGGVEAVLAWALREGVTNVVRHARATTCTLRLTAEGESTALTVTDDGVGAAVAPAWSHGLDGLAERVAAGHGRLEAGPCPDGGYRLRVSVPLCPQ